MMGRQRVSIFVAILACSASAGCGRSGPPRIQPELPDGAAASKAMDQYDANHDGFLDAGELEKAPGLKVAIKRVDTNQDGKISREEIADRIKSWADSRAARVPVRARVTHNGKPLAGAKVIFKPEEFLGASIKSGTGTTSETGVASISAMLAANSNVRGLSPGFYRVEITKDGENIPARYNTHTTLGAEACAEEKQESSTIDLKY